MRRVFRGKKFQRYSRMRSNAERKRRAVSASKRKISNRKQNRVGNGRSKSRPSKPVKVMVVPSDFSLLRNRNEIISFFGSVSVHVTRKVPVLLDLRGVTNLEPEALLYLLSWMDTLSSRGYAKFISGNTPKDPALKALLACSGFYSHVHSTEPLGSSDKVLKIRSGSRVENIVAKSVKDFAQKHLGEFPGVKRSCLYPTIVECMANTKNHAYKKSDDRKWWLMALKDDSKNCVHFTFLDNGQGIPSTVARRLAPSELVATDSQLIQSALLGQDRTRTKLSWRGKGLPRIHSYLKNGDISDLVILSGKGHYESNTGMVTQAKTKFLGTLLSWNYTKS